MVRIGNGPQTRPSNIIHQIKAKNLRIQELHDAGTKELYKQRYCTVSMAMFLSSEKYRKIVKFLFGGLFTNISHSNYF